GDRMNFLLDVGCSPVGEAHDQRSVFTVRRTLHTFTEGVCARRVRHGEIVDQEPRTVEERMVRQLMQGPMWDDHQLRRRIDQMPDRPDKVVVQLRQMIMLGYIPEAVTLFGASFAEMKLEKVERLFDSVQAVETHN